MMRSLVTFATIDAAATQAATSSPFHMARAGTPRPRTGNPSVSTYPGVAGQPGQRAPHPGDVADVQPAARRSRPPG